VRKGVVLGEGSSKRVDVARFRKTPARMEAGAELRRKVDIPEGAQVAGFVGRFTKDKGIEELVAAFTALEPSHPDLHALLVGRVHDDDRPSAGALRTIETHPKIHRSGLLQDVAPAYQAMDFLLLPSYREGFPNVVLEASSAGRPTIGFRSTGVRDAIIDVESGQLVPVGDADALAEAMATYLSDPELAARHGAAALARVDRVFAQEKVFEAVAGLYRDALAAHPDTAHLVDRLGSTS